MLSSSEAIKQKCEISGDNECKNTRQQWHLPIGSHCRIISHGCKKCVCACVCACVCVSMCLCVCERGKGLTFVTQGLKTRHLSILAFLFSHILHCICFKVHFT